MPKPVENLPPESGYRIGELAKLTNSTTRTLRFYEELDLLEPIRNASGQRLYSEKAIDRLHFINELKCGGFSLQDIKVFFDAWHKSSTGDVAAGQTISLVEAKLVEIAELQKKIAKLSNELKSMVTYVLSCQGCDHKPSSESCGDCDRHGSKDPLLMTILKKD